MEDVKLSPDQFQALAEFIAMQAAACMLEHESRVHAPTDIKAAQAVKDIGTMRLKMLEVLRERLQRS